MKLVLFIAADMDGYLVPPHTSASSWLVNYMPSVAWWTGLSLLYCFSHLGCVACSCCRVFKYLITVSGLDAKAHASPRLAALLLRLRMTVAALLVNSMEHLGCVIHLGGG